MNSVIFFVRQKMKLLNWCKHKHLCRKGVLVFWFSRFLVFSFWWVHLSGQVALFTCLGGSPLEIFDVLLKYWIDLKLHKSDDFPRYFSGGLLAPFFVFEIHEA